MSRIVNVFLFMIVIGLFAVAAYLLYDNVPRGALPLLPTKSQELPPVAYSSSIQFYPNMRFKNSRISYSIESACSPAQQANARGAFALLADATPLSFYESNTPEIRVVCSELAPPSGNRHHFIAGEGGPTEILNGTYYSVILSGTFSLYRDETCETPHIALHEALHVLGFDHTNNPQSILYPTLDCAQQLDQYLIDEIGRLYGVPSKPDLNLLSATGNKSGKYVSFEVQVTNEGLADVASTSLRVYADDRFVKDFDLSEIPISSRKTLTVTNLNVGRGTQRITLEVDGTHTVDELQETNNKQELVLATT